MATGSKRNLETAALIVGAGSGERFGRAKAFVSWRGEPLLFWAARPFARIAQIDRLVLVVREADQEAAYQVLHRLGKRGSVAVGGATRSASVRAGLATLPRAVGRVLVHDAARPNVSEQLVARVLEATGECVLPALQIHDALHRAQAQAAVIDRNGVLRVQTPQMLDRDLLARLHAENPEAADDGGLAIAAGVQVQYVAGEEGNVKVTTPQDLAWLDRITGGLRVGQGFDIHRLEANRRLVVCGVELESERGAIGHSDADAACHALMDAILGAASLPDIGYYFPPGDPRFANADSIGLLAEVGRLARTAGWSVVHADLTVLLEAPKISPHRDEMQERLAGALGLDAAAISIKATTAEGLGPIGAGDGIAAWAVATLRAWSED
ncbi:MAG: 2-C-methyl-D-erythritol 2,4-cyclodiphosphate synthase [Thermaerobacter sp.]|nr:2-C-methyl-D-erythritol 2,4-cyclodiphosphate synthase [Thermaerobacter sp.]